ncbi:pentapeptide repeat-containing protein [Streptomyces sp. NPDC005808]|uniref:pentapeptide repeat-containing protein n=1 Tax=Streptomyces sp. NPDC005808 TaxID=3364734 RepID=UPI00368C6EFD
MGEPTWATCQADPLCSGVQVSPYDRCIAHLAGNEQSGLLDGIAVGESVDFRGVTFNAALTQKLQKVIARCTAFGISLFTDCQFLAPIDFSDFKFQGACWFDGASFDAADFSRSIFHESACFLGATFHAPVTFQLSSLGRADLSRAQFKGGADFSSLQRRPSVNFQDCTFEDITSFENSELENGSFERTQFQMVRFSRATFLALPTFRRAEFGGLANFEKVRFPYGANFRYSSFPEGCLFTGSEFGSRGPAVFAGAQFGQMTGFTEVKFESEVSFSGAVCKGSISFKYSQFSDLLHGPLSAKDVNLGYASFDRSVRFEVSSKNLGLSRATFSAAAAFSARFSTVDLTDVHLSSPLTISSYHSEFTVGDLPVPDPELGDLDPLSKVTRLAGVDAKLLVLSDVDLAKCSFAGAYHLDQITLEGDCRFATPPTGIKWGVSTVPFRWWTQRKTLSDEVSWRSQRPVKLLNKKGWEVSREVPTQTPSIQNIAATYRQLRKAFEDGLNEPGAADFYYGEMEMRRRDEHASRSERGLLHAYWALSGFGLRASRAIGWLAASMAVTIVLMMGCGLPNQAAKQTATGIASAPGKETTLVIEVPKQNLTIPFDKRWTLSRLERSGRIVINSVIFRSSGQGLTSAGVWIEMTSRFTEPIFLGLSILAIRGRIKRK